MYYKGVNIEIGYFVKSGKRWKYESVEHENVYCKIVNSTMEIVISLYDYTSGKTLFKLKEIDLSGKHTTYSTGREIKQPTYSKHLKKFGLKSKLKKPKAKGKEKVYTIDCTGNACVGDHVKFEKAVFTGEYPNAEFSHNETVKGIITKDSYGAKKQQHTFTLQINKNETMRIKGRNLYKNGTKRKPWNDEKERIEVLEEKYKRGNQARSNRSIRIEEKNQLWQEY